MAGCAALGESRAAPTLLIAALAAPPFETGCGAAVPRRTASDRPFATNREKSGPAAGRKRRGKQQPSSPRKQPFDEDRRSRASDFGCCSTYEEVTLKYDLQSLGFGLPAATKFCASLTAQLSDINIRKSEDALVKSITASISDIDSVVAGMMSTNVQLPPPQIHQPSPVDPTIDCAFLIPKSQWIYETPDKQRIKKMEELNFNGQRSLEPAVMERDENHKTVYVLQDRLKAKVDLSCLDPEVPIDLNYLKPVCVISSENEANRSFEDNQFLTQSMEESITIEEAKQCHEPMVTSSMERPSNASRSLKRRHEDDDGLNWYEKHMKMLATCKPVKVQEKVDRRTLLHRKSLSFQEDTPPSHHRMRGRFRSMDDGESCRIEFIEESDFSLLESEFYNPAGTMAAPFELPGPQFRPRTNFGE